MNLQPKEEEQIALKRINQSILFAIPEKGQ